jgi:hypothetical protein
MESEDAVNSQQLIKIRFVKTCLLGKFGEERDVLSELAWQLVLRNYAVYVKEQK